MDKNVFICSVVDEVLGRKTWKEVTPHDVFLLLSVLYDRIEMERLRKQESEYRSGLFV